jgi:hypothetical protein
MCHRFEIHSTRRLNRVCGAALLAGALAALGGCDAAPDDRTAPSAARDSAAAAAPAEPLFDARGEPLLSPIGLMPADTAARTRNGLYASRAQYEWEALVHSPFTVLLDVDTLGSVQAAARQAEELRAIGDMGGVAFFVRARRATEAADVVNALCDAGFKSVFLIR